MRGFNRNKYMRVMDKIYENRPKQLVTFAIGKSSSTPGITCTIYDLEAIINVTTVDNVYDKPTDTYLITKQVSYTIRKSLLEGNLFSDGTVVNIQKLLSDKKNDGYGILNIIPNYSNVLDEEGYVYPATAVSYGEYSDGGFREFITFNCFTKQLII